MEYNGLPMTAEEKIRFLEQCLDNKEKVNKQLRKDIKWYEKEEDRLREENKKLNEFKTKREESMFYFKALAERVEPINSKEAEDLQKYKKLFEKLYREELSCLEEENKNLKESLDIATKCSSKEEDGIIRLSEENKKLKEELKKDDREVQVDVDKELLKANDYLIKENKKLKEKIDELEKCNLNLQERLDRKEEVNKKLREELSAYDREYFDEDKKANNIFIDKSGKVIKGGEFTTLC